MKLRLRSLRNVTCLPSVCFTRSTGSFWQTQLKATDIERTRWLQFVEIFGVERVLWQTLFRKIAQCPTVQRRGKIKEDENDAASDSGEEKEDSRDLFSKKRTCAHSVQRIVYCV